MVKKIITYLVTFVFTLGVLFGALTATSKVPNSKIKNNIAKSAIYFSDKDPYRFTYGNRMCYIEDNYADAILLGVIWNVKDVSPVKTSLDTKYNDGQIDGEDYGEAYGLFMNTMDKVEANTDYTRYWHGSMVFIRPLLMFTTIENIRNIGIGAIIILSLCLCFLLIKKKYYIPAIAFILSMIMIQFWTIRLSMEYEPMFILAILMSICFILLEKKGDNVIIILAIVSGTMTAFFDFLTTETLTILLPLLFVFMIREQDGRNEDFKKNLGLVIRGLSGWGIAYVGTFLTKWTLATIVTGEDKFKAAINSAGVRVNGSIEDEKISKIETFLKAVPANISTLFNGCERVDWGMIFAGILALIMVFGGFFYIFRGNRFRKEFVWIALIIGGMPYLRYLLLSNHSYLHEFFTYRAQLTTLTALLAIILYNCEFHSKKASKKKNYEDRKRGR